MRESGLQYDVIEGGLKIEKGIPVPQEGSRRPRTRWDLIEVGDSVLLENRTRCVTALDWARRNGRKFTCRKQKEKPYGYRIWRIA